jgi:hypothetical protein
MMEVMHLQGNESCLELENEQKMKEQPVLKKMSLPREHLILFSFGLLQGCIPTSSISRGLNSS